ncbi:hypothetical protein [Paraburkholderia youngii]|uniref:hypothetical protein n=1 Tax=Paraburkholderia youngii TaxID=2782701 RepID=UPI003D1E1B24
MFDDDRFLVPEDFGHPDGFAAHLGRRPATKPFEMVRGSVNRKPSRRKDRKDDSTPDVVPVVQLTYLPLYWQAPIEQKHALVKRLNEDVFLPVFTVDPDEDLTVAYVMPYAHGLIAGNFVGVITRFASLLEFVVETYNGDGLIDSGAPNAVPAVAHAR